MLSSGILFSIRMILKWQIVFLWGCGVCKWVLNCGSCGAWLSVLMLWPWSGYGVLCGGCALCAASKEFHIIDAHLENGLCFAVCGLISANGRFTLYENFLAFQ